MVKRDFEDKERQLSSKEQNFEFKWKQDFSSKIEKDKIISDLQNQTASL